MEYPLRGPNFMSKEIYFVRHGVPENDADSFRFSGFTRDMLGEEDHPLAERGRAQARAVAPMASARVRCFKNSPERIANQPKTKKVTT